jgi:hypothetical protein
MGMALVFCLHDGVFIFAFEARDVGKRMFGYVLVLFWTRIAMLT